MTGPEPGGEWLAAQTARHPRVMGSVVQIVAMGERSNDAVLLGRQVLERKLGADPETVFTAADYRYAARQIDGIAPQGHSAMLEDIASADGELRAAWAQWEARYRDRHQTESERITESWLQTGTLVERSGTTVRGVDGCHYTQAYFPHTSKPAIVVTSSALAQDAVVFPNLLDAKAWLGSRRPGGNPLMTTADTPARPRVTQEEEILAWLMKSPGDTASVTGELGPAAMTSNLRAELLEALKWTTRHGGAPDYQVIAQAFGRRLLRAPGPVAADIGWPTAVRANTYLQRIVATSVTGAQVHRAVDAVARADAEAVQRAAARVTAVPTALRAELPADQRSSPQPGALPGPQPASQSPPGVGRARTPIQQM